MQPLVVSLTLEGPLYLLVVHVVPVLIISLWLATFSPLVTMDCRRKKCWNNFWKALIESWVIHRVLPRNIWMLQATHHSCNKIMFFYDIDVFLQLSQWLVWLVSLVQAQNFQSNNWLGLTFNSEIDRIPIFTWLINISFDLYR